jgi:Na+/H+ antiporter NhaD/arsenite permease-like protein
MEHGAFAPNVIFGLNPMWVAVVVLVAAYAVIIAEKLNRSIIALLGACLGGNGTLIGASANLTVAGIAERNGISFRFWDCTKLAFPLMLISVAISRVCIWLRYL